MTVKAYKDIRAALEKTLDDASGIPAISWENTDYRPTTGTAFIDARFIPTARRPAVRGTSPQHRYQGILQLLVHYPEKGGTGTSSDTIDTLIGLFDSTTDISYTNADTDTIVVSIDYAEIAGSYTDSPWYVTPINIGWYIYNA